MPVWREVKWPFLLDQWGIGRAYRCAPADCGTEINLYLRAKVGFCNCATGVSDDAELDRVGDLELFSEEFVGLTDGRPVSVGRMQGAQPALSRRHSLCGGRATCWAIGFNDQCDVAVATVLADPRSAERGRGPGARFSQAPIRCSAGPRRSSAETAF